MTNFDFLTSDPQFNTFSSVAVLRRAHPTYRPRRLCVELAAGRWSSP